MRTDRDPSFILAPDHVRAATSRCRVRSLAGVYRLARIRPRRPVGCRDHDQGQPQAGPAGPRAREGGVHRHAGAGSVKSVREDVQDGEGLPGRSWPQTAQERDRLCKKRYPVGSTADLYCIQLAIDVLPGERAARRRAADHDREDDHLHPGADGRARGGHRRGNRRGDRRRDSRVARLTAGLRPAYDGVRKSGLSTSARAEPVRSSRIAGSHARQPMLSRASPGSASSARSAARGVLGKRVEADVFLALGDGGTAGSKPTPERRSISANFGLRAPP